MKIRQIKKIRYCRIARYSVLKQERNTAHGRGMWYIIHGGSAINEWVIVQCWHHRNKYSRENDAYAVEGHLFVSYWILSETIRKSDMANCLLINLCPGTLLLTRIRQTTGVWGRVKQLHQWRTTGCNYSSILYRHLNAVEIQCNDE